MTDDYGLGKSKGRPIKNPEGWWQQELDMCDKWLRLAYPEIYEEWREYRFIQNVLEEELLWDTGQI